MSCPFCGADAVYRDYAPPRPFAYLTGGAAMLVATRFLPPGAMAEWWSDTFRQVYLLVAMAAMVMGAVELNRHGNRFCGVCGMKFRQTRRTAPGFDRAALLERSSSPGPIPGAATGTARWAAASRRPSDAPPPDTPIPPLLKCLRFKNPVMRREAAETLTQLTGQSFGEDADAWDRWWAEQPPSP